MRYTIDYKEEITSTNEECMKLGRSGHEGRYALVANRQTQGRGRMGRDWYSAEGEGLYMSILERPKGRMESVPQLSLFMALALRKAIHRITNMDCQIKWPNDIVYKGKKVAGILLQSQAKPLQQVPIMDTDFVVIGLGVNLFQEDFPDELKDKATSIYMEGFCEKNEIDLKNRLIESIIENWKEQYREFEVCGSLTRVCNTYNFFLVSKDKEVVVHSPDGDIRGVCLGINTDGGLMVKLSDGVVKHIDSGEVSVRGVNGYVD